MERSEGDMSLKNPVTLPGIDPGTVRLVAQRLNHYATPGPQPVGLTGQKRREGYNDNKSIKKQRTTMRERKAEMTGMTI
jgi:hypothetical protein